MVQDSDFTQYWQRCSKPTNLHKCIKGKLVCHLQRELRGQHTFVDRVLTVFRVRYVVSRTERWTADVPAFNSVEAI